MRKNNLYTLSAALMALIAAPSVSAADYISHRSSSGLTAPSAAPAKEDANVILLGHVSPQEDIYPYTGFNNGGSEDLTLEFGVRLTSDMLAPYAGAKITGIRVGWGEGPQPYSPDMTAFLRSDMNGDNITSGTATVNMGWNEIKYDNPQTITGDSDLFIGGVVPYPPQIAWLATGCWGGADLADDIQYMGVQEYRDADGNIEWEHPVSSMEKILILAIVEAAGDDYEDMMSMPTLRLNDVQSLDEEGAARVIIRNDGTNTITDFDVRIECGDMSWTTIVDLPGEGLPSGTTGTLNIPFQALASGVHKIWVSKVNGTDVAKPEVHEARILAVSKATAAEYTRRPLVERWISESNHYTAPYTDQIFVPGIEDYRDNVSVVAHHLDDQFMQYRYFDDEVQCEDLQMLVDMVNGDKTKVSVPCMAVDRSFHTDTEGMKADAAGVFFHFVYPMFVGIIYDQALSTPTFASVKANARINGDICDITVEGEIASGVLTDDENLYLTVYLLEDGIVSTSQEFPDDEELLAKYQGKYTHNDLIRAQPTDMYGDAVGGAGTYKKTYQIDVDETWKTSDMRVLAFLNRGIENDNFSRQVVNSCESDVITTGIGNTLLQQGVNVKVSGRDILVDGDFDSVEIFASNGARVDGKGLLPGVYVVKVTGGQATSSVKVMVK